MDAIQLVAAKFFQQSYTLMLVSASSTQIPNAPTAAVGLDNITPVRSVRNLGIYVDSYVSMRTHVVKTVSSCFTILRRIRSIRRSVTSSVLKSLVVLLVLPRMDYGSATLTGLVRHLLDIHQTLMIQECCCTIGILGSEIRPRSMMLRIRPRSRL